MRLVHFTDVHFYVPPSPGEVFGKRALGLVNLYVVGRARYFDAGAVVGRLVEDARAFAPDVAAITGDLSAMSTELEFAAARDGFAGLLDHVPTVVIPGNHDRYTYGATRSARMEATFGAWMGGGTWSGDAWADPDVAAGDAVDRPVVFRIGEVSFIGTDPCRPGLRSSGRFPPGALAAIERLTAQERAAGRFVVLCMHYPPLDDAGEPYRRPGHCLVDVDAVLDTLRRSAPDLVLHGHRHACWRTSLSAGERTVTVLNCGSSSAVTPLVDRAAGYYIVDIDDGRITSVRRRVLLADADAVQDHPGSFD